MQQARELLRNLFLGPEKVQSIPVEKQTSVIPGTSRCTLLNDFRFPSGWGEVIYVGRPDDVAYSPIYVSHCANRNGQLTLVDRDRMGKTIYVPVEEMLCLHQDLRDRLLVFGANLPPQTYQNIAGHRAFEGPLGSAIASTLQRTGHTDVIQWVEQRILRLETESRAREAQQEEIKADQKRAACRQQLIPILLKVKNFLTTKIPGERFSLEESQIVYFALKMAEAGDIQDFDIQFFCGKTRAELIGMLGLSFWQYFTPPEDRKES